MSALSKWNNAQQHVARRLTDFCVARDAQRGTAWERLSVAYPDPILALRAIELFQVARRQVSTAVA